jgi:hypothetical protein
MKKYFVIISIFCSVSLFAQSSGNTGLSFLKFGFGARNIAMGDIGTASANDVTALNYNPALLTSAENSEIMINHSSWIQDVSTEMLGVNFKMFGLPFAVGLNTTSIDGIEVRTKPGDPLSTFNAHYFYGSISSAIKITNNISAGVSIKYLYESLFADQANGAGFDFGFLYSGLIPNLNIGASVRNLGSMNKLRNESTKLPSDLRIAAAYDFSVESLNSEINFTAGLQKYFDVDNTHFHIGGEFGYNEVVFVRGGYITGYDSKNITAGLGIRWGSFAFDYAYVPFDFGLGNSSIITVKYTF